MGPRRIPPMQDRSDTSAANTPRVGLFVTCLVDLFRPGVGFAAVELLQAAGCTVEVPASQVCCGQPTFNSGDMDATRAIARNTIEQFEPYDFVVAPSGSCTGMLREHYPGLFADDPEWGPRAQQLAGRCHELMSFLHDQRGFDAVDADYDSVATYHDSCSGLRELGVKDQPRALLSQVRGLTLKEMPETDVCCGFGGTFCVKYPEISTRLVSDKIANIESVEPDTVLGGDLGCLLNIAGRLAREGSRIRVLHVAEVLAGRAGGPAIGEEDQ